MRRANWAPKQEFGHAAHTRSAASPNATRPVGCQLRGLADELDGPHAALRPLLARASHFDSMGPPADLAPTHRARMRRPARAPLLAAVLARGSRAVLGRGSRALCSLPTAVPQPPPSEDRAAVRVHVKQTTEMLAATVLTPLNARLLGPLERSPFAEGIPLPFVLLLGNHSSGKSSFINFVLGRPVQAN